MRSKTIRFKIIVSIFLYIIIIGGFGNLYLYNYLSRIVTRKAVHLDQIYLDTVQSQIEHNFSEMYNLAVLCASDPSVMRVFNFEDYASPEGVRERLNVQDLFNSYIRSSIINMYVDKLILFNDHGLIVHALGRQYGDIYDIRNIKNLEIFKTLELKETNRVLAFGKSISAAKKTSSCMVIFRIDNIYRENDFGYLYLEVGLDMVSDILRTNKTEDTVYLAASPLQSLIMASGEFPADTILGKPLDNLVKGEKIKDSGRTYRVDMSSLDTVPAELYHVVDTTDLSADDVQIFFTIFVVILTSLLSAAGITVILTMYLTKPIQLLINRIKKISENDFSIDPEIEKSNDEIGSIGKVVNEMSANISTLLKETRDMYEEKKNTEIALLQTQVNPHFLYNTLNSIQWMAEIQKNTGIVEITRSLINLLRNIAEISGDKILLEDEIRLLEDYVSIQSIRFMGIFELRNLIDPDLYGYRIVKFTLQPIVENAIIHGIQPTGKFGIITLSAEEHSKYLDIIVEDSGEGMSKTEIDEILFTKKQKDKTSLNKIGVSNVHTRLQLIYGNDCGLFYESKAGVFTRVTIRILKEN